MQEGDFKPARILEHLITSVFILDDDLRLRHINPSAEMLVEVSVRKARGQPLDRLLVLPEGMERRMDQVLEAQQPFTEHEARLRLWNGRTVTADCGVTGMETEGEQLLMLEVMVIDRQVRMSHEESLLAQHQTVRSIVRGLAHEIKNPLGGLRGAAQLLERELPEPELAEYTRVIIEEADRLQALVDRMLGPRDRPRTRMVNIHEVLERVRTLVVAESPDGITVRRDYDPAIPELMADPDQLIQAVLNLVRNAVQALGEEGEITLRTRVDRQVTIGNRCHRLVLMIEIRDNGPGIPPGIEQEIFYPMITGRADGEGLGLSIAQAVVNRHGGLIECESEPGNTVFRLLLPLESGK